jgi:hypothetical protein
MTLNRLTANNPIDLPMLNKIIDEVNKLEGANRFSAKTSRVQNYSTSGSNIHVHGFRRTRKLTRADGDYYGSIGAVDFPSPTFLSPPIVVVTFEGTYLVPNINGISNSGFNLGALRVSKSWADIPTSVTFNVIAIGPVK